MTAGSDRNATAADVLGAGQAIAPGRSWSSD
jgi:hypothetical protein